jgi:hypothetical protein
MEIDSTSPWLKSYLLLALRMDRAFSRVDTSFFLDTYYGPSVLKEQVAHEDEIGFETLAGQAEELAAQLPEQGFSTRRAEYLAKHIQALETMARVKAGEVLPFHDLVQQVLDITPMWIPEEEFQQALDLLDLALPGKGSLRERFQAWQAAMTLPVEQSEAALPILNQMLTEARRRTRRLLPLPENETLEIIPKHGVNYGAANWYQGHYRSWLEINLDRPVFLFGLLYQATHEGYPGHHTEACMKELYLYRQAGYVEQGVFFALGPQLTIAEGIASLALEIIFTPQEAANWARQALESMLPPAALDADLELIWQAARIISPDDLSSNLAQMIEAGRSKDEAAEYALDVTPYSEEFIRTYLPWLESPLARLYAFTYSHGKRLIQPHLSGENREGFIHQLFTEQVYPAMLV